MQVYLDPLFLLFPFRGSVHQVVQFDNTRVINLQMLPLRFLGTAYDTPQGQAFALEMERALKPHMASPSLLCGDFNVENANELYREIIQKSSMKNALPSAGTRPNNKQSDYIFYSAELRCEDAGVIKTNTDHYLCWARFSI